ncbi:dipeptide/tripeptide permease A [Yersinia pestis subsp. microtus bv. Caucasica]|uniref:dipeptide/tripeptide permease DtpA n=1 Tax=Yersinia pestis TaxID=632 RepID=UPI000150212A|nr:dipeptide/tripeptide permease DtpA [Yersinia pestis]ABP39188.1 proton dependent peptide transporter [Yersinia pestis Pestoides F]AJI99890.1 amino acid/peptide transporter family protein [Yersinia pestis Pestoides F]AJK24714.1 amino acid/peptide transporter family protein [Yersinia pestis Pestoides G]AKS58292.1 amino acid/peptide transporter family protein [Yersinia pestis 1412]AKS78565.1 amino acid/peptide transporter family protein [Yersinia pestis 1413]
MSTANNNQPESISMNAFKQPKAFYLIFSIELWERFGYYGLQGIMAVYLVKMLGMSEADSITLFSSFSALVYGFVAIGGWLGDKVLGAKRVIVLGALTLAVGYSMIAYSGHEIFWVYLGMATIAVGNGLFKANPSSLLSTCYSKDDPRLDGAFTMYYMSINIGSFFSMLATPWLAAKYGWSVAFSLSVVGMLITLVNFWFCRKWVKNQGSKPDFLPLQFKKLLMVLVGIIALITLSNWLLHNQIIARWALVSLGIIFIFTKETLFLQGIARRRMIVAFLLMLEAVIFFVLYSQMPTSLNFFAIHNVEHSIFGIGFEPEQFQALNPFWIMLASPILAAIYNKMGDRLPMPHKFAFGMMLCSAAFLVLPWGASFANEHGIVSVNWLILSYALQSIGELMISGLGLAMVAQLVPQRLMGFIMGSWFLTTAAAALIAGKVAALTAVPSDAITDAHASLAIYSHVFMQIGIVTAIIAVLMMLTAPKLYRMTLAPSDHNDVKIMTQ